MKTYLEKLYHYQSLSYDEAFRAMHLLSQGEVNQSQIASFITAYLMRPIGIGELRGFTDALLDLAIPVRFEQPVMDVCGTGGDGKNTFNISTLTALVVAGCGIPVAKHGNYGVSSISGSSDVLQYLGYRFTQDAGLLQKQLDTCNICFLHAPLFHPALRHVALARKELGTRTFFNMLGPLINPARPEYRLIGVFHAELGRSYHYLLQQAGTSYAVVHSTDGYDEMSCTADTKVFSHRGEMLLSASAFGMRTLDPHEIYGGASIGDAASVFTCVLQGKGSDAQHQVVIANTAVALQSIHSLSNEDAVAMATESLLGGSAHHLFKTLLTLNP